MAISQEVYKVQRLALIQAHRSLDSAEPDDTHPDVDDRGFLTPEFGPIVSVTQGKTVTVRLTRKKFDDAAPLTIVSNDATIASIADPADGKLPAATDMDIQITGVDGGSDDHKEALLQVKAGDLIIFQLHVWVFRELTVDVTPHRITINGGGTNGTAPVADIPAIITKVQSVWGHYGIKINTQPILDHTITLAAANTVNDDTNETAKLLDPSKYPRQDPPPWVKKTINAYFVPIIASAGPGTTLGIGISRKSAAEYHYANPGIILADGPPTVHRSYVMFWANDLAHEIGHFFTLEHVENAQIPDEREDSWSRRRLMHPFNEMPDHNPWPHGHEKFRPRFDDAGYGVGQFSCRRGCMITLKKLAQFHFDGEALTARAVIQSKAGPY